ncbi:MAG: hypothetical protein AMQ74_00340 [Candidatus Methanofastidiosum methylothiophilum]|uniref:Uncharacterized protein n=1 Tax=Candidatus Methanofastidiosum methylothiophilum TaxID=1705564 RepID=A0A150J8N9_9EURY|nr:MAG: hypothetical protein AMQ74_00340 [Candidatus Methanofastidiosum methylthiophilus]
MVYFYDPGDSEPKRKRLVPTILLVIGFILLAIIRIFLEEYIN